MNTTNTNKTILSSKKKKNNKIVQLVTDWALRLDLNTETFT